MMKFERTTHPLSSLSDTRSGDLGKDISAGKQLGKPLFDWAVNFGLNSRLFHCQATDILHAIKQCMHAFPGEQIVAATQDSPPSASLFTLNPDSETGEWNPSGEFSVVCDDQRGITDTVYFYSAMADGRTEDVVKLQVEIDRIEGSDGRGKLNLQFVDNTVECSIRRRGDEYVFALEAALTVSKTILNSGTRGFSMH